MSPQKHPESSCSSVLRPRCLLVRAAAISTSPVPTRLLLSPVFGYYGVFEQLSTEMCCCEAPSPASPALVVVQRAELCWGALPNCSTQRNTSISSGTTETTASEHFWAAVTGWGLLDLAFLLIPSLQQRWTSWDWVTSACEDLAAKGRVGSTLYFLS